MGTIKSYSDLQQSRKLAEILPIESADMWYQYTGISIKDGSKKPIYFPMVIRDCESDEDIPCWSLAALLDVIPYNVSFNKAVYRFKMVKFFDHWECYHENFGSVSTEIFKANNPIDACYEMILKLHELKML